MSPPASDREAAPSEVAARSTAAIWDEFRRTASAESRAELFALYADFARRVARRQYLRQPSGEVELAELYQFAYAGLLESIDRFTPDRGVTFEGFAVRRITGSILDGLSSMSERREQISYLGRLRRERIRSLEAADTVQPQASSLEALADIAIGLALGLMLEGTGLYVADNAPDVRPNSYEALAWRQTVRRLAQEVAALPPRERAVIAHHYIDGMSFTDVGVLLGLSKGRISQLHRAALTILKRRIGPAQGPSLSG